jgi:D-alanyl-D-alanine carboxypeptidase-like protein
MTTYRMLALPLALMAIAPFHGSIKPLPQPLQQRLEHRGFWQRGCPVGLGDLRLLRVSYQNFDGEARTGQLIVNKTAAPKLKRVFRKLYGLNFPIRHMRLRDMYGTASQRVKDGDATGSFECRRAVPSPCNPSGQTNWSNHAYGLAVDINPRENPYVGCGQSYNKTAQRYRDRSVHRPGMVTPRAIQAFASVGWGWGGSWSGNTKDYMHFSHNGH